MKKYMNRKSVKKGNYLVDLAREFDAFVLLTSNLAEPLEVNSRPYMVMECLCDSETSLSNRDIPNAKTFLYAGTIDKAYSIVDLLVAFSELPDAELWICGTGDAKSIVEEYAKQYRNIKYYGFVSPSFVSTLRDKCGFLINPRRPDGTYTKYSFPSKTAEYMVSGKPTVMYKLEGIPDEYDPFLNYLSANEVEGIILQLKTLLNADYNLLCDKAMQARSFMLENKTAEVQADRVWSFLLNCL